MADGEVLSWQLGFSISEPDAQRVWTTEWEIAMSLRLKKLNTLPGFGRGSFGIETITPFVTLMI